MARPKANPRSKYERKLRRLMAAAGIDTYKCLADAADVSESTIQCLATGNRQATIYTIKKLAAALGVEPSELI